MTDHRDSGFKPASPPQWKIWTTTILGVLASGVFTVSRGIGAGADFVDSEERLAAAIGGGIAIGIVVSLVAYFLVFRHAAPKIKWATCLAFVTAGVVGGILSTNL